MPSTSPSLTVQEYLQKGIEARLSGKPVPRHVQVLANGIARCALILDVWYRDDSAASALFKLRLLDTGSVLHAPSRLVRQCEGFDGRCQCAQNDAAGHPTRGPACGDTAGARQAVGGTKC